MRRVLAIILVLTLIMVFSISNTFAETYGTNFSKLSDPALLPYIESNLYAELVATLDSDEYFVENVKAIYISQEYLDELAFNSQANVFFWVYA